MLTIGGLILLLGYNNLYFGLDQLQGGNNGWFELLIPGKFQNRPKDGAATGASPPGPAAASSSSSTASNAPAPISVPGGSQPPPGVTFPSGTGPILVPGGTQPPPGVTF